MGLAGLDRQNRRRLDPEFWTEAEVEQTADGREFRSRFRMADLNPLEQVMVQQTHLKYGRMAR